MSVGRDVPERYQSLAKSAEKSRSHAVKLFCLECVGYVTKDVTDCTATKCPLWLHRPYRHKAEKTRIRGAQPIQFQRKPAASKGSTCQTDLDTEGANFDGEAA